MIGWPPPPPLVPDLQCLSNRLHCGHGLLPPWPLWGDTWPISRVCCSLSCVSCALVRQEAPGVVNSSALPEETSFTGHSQHPPPPSSTSSTGLTLPPARFKPSTDWRWKESIFSSELIPSSHRCVNTTLCVSVKTRHVGPSESELQRQGGLPEV